MSYFVRSGSKRAEPSGGERPELGAVLDHYGVEWRDGGGNVMIRCPLHVDETPSCSMKPMTGLWNCKSCGEGGDSWSLIMKKEGVDFVGAKQYAIDRGLWTDAGGSRASGRGPRALQRGGGSQGSGTKYIPKWRR